MTVATSTFSDAGTCVCLLKTSHCFVTEDEGSPAHTANFGFLPCSFQGNRQRQAMNICKAAEHQVHIETRHPQAGVKATQGLVKASLLLCWHILPNLGTNTK